MGKRPYRCLMIIGLALVLAACGKTPSEHCDDLHAEKSTSAAKKLGNVVADPDESDQVKEEAFECLVKATAYEHTREAAFSQASSHIGSLDRATAIKILIRQTEPVVAEHSAKLLQQIGAADSDVVTYLAGLLTSEESTAIAAAQALGAIGPKAKDAIPELISALGSSKPEVGDAAMEALKKVIHGPALGDGLDLLDMALQTQSEERVLVRIMRVIQHLGPKAERTVDNLIPHLGEGEKAVRKEAAITLGKIGLGAKNAIPDLIIALGDQVTTDEAFAALKLIIVGDNIAQGVQDLLAAIDHPGDSSTQQKVIELLGWLGRDAIEAIDKLTEIAVDEKCEWKDADVRKEAATSLGRIGGHLESVVEILVKLLSDKKEGSDFVHLAEVRAGAASGLAHVNEETVDLALTALIPALGDPEVDNESVAAVQALISFKTVDKERVINDDVAYKTLEALVQAPLLENPEVSAQAAQILRSIAIDEGGETLVVDKAAELLVDALWLEEPVSEAASGILQNAQLTAALKKASALRLASELGGSQDELIPKILGAMGTDIVPELLYSEKPEGGDAIGGIIESITDVSRELIRIIQKKDPHYVDITDVRPLAARKLGKLGTMAKDPDKAIPALGEVLKDTDDTDLGKACIDALVSFAQTDDKQAAVSALLASYGTDDYQSFYDDYALDTFYEALGVDGLDLLGEILTSDESASVRSASSLFLLELLLSFEHELEEDPYCKAAGDLVSAVRADPDREVFFDVYNVTDTNSVEELKATFDCPFINLDSD